MSDINVFKSFSNFEFRGISFPVSRRKFGVAQEVAEHKFIFRDDPILEALGRKAQTWNYSIPCFEGLTLPGFQNAFTELLPTLLEAFRDRSIGILEDPIDGSQPALVASYDYELDPSHLDGTMLEVNFIHAPTDIFQGDDRPSIQSASAEAGQLDDLVGATNWGTFTQPDSFKNPIDAISALAQNAIGNINRMGAQIDKQIFKLNKMNSEINQLKDVRNWAVLRASRNMQATLLDTKKTLGVAPNGKKFRTYTTTQDISISVLAARLKVSVRDLVNQNPAIGIPSVLSGTIVKYFA